MLRVIVCRVRPAVTTNFPRRRAQEVTIGGVRNFGRVNATLMDHNSGRRSESPLTQKTRQTLRLDRPRLRPSWRRLHTSGVPPL